VVGDATRALLESFPLTRGLRAQWCKEVARNEEIALLVVRSLGGRPVAVEQWFPCALHDGIHLARLTRDRKDEIVYHDPGLAGTRREFQTIPELALALQTGIPRRLNKFEHLLWRLRVLHGAELFRLPPFTLPALPDDMPKFVHAARAGFELFFRIRLMLGPEARGGVPFTRGFVQQWCGLTQAEARQAIDVLRAELVIVKCGALPSGREHETNLYIPGSLNSNGGWVVA
jgi:hypothetical protein